MKNKYDLLRPVQIIIIATWFSGCTSLPYLHSNETEIETQAIKEAAANIKVDQNFDEIKKQLVAFANREDKSITDYLISKRDIQLARLVRDDRLNKDKTSAISLLQTFIDERFKKITQDYEIKIPEGKDELYRFMFLPDLLYRIQVTLKSELATYHYALQDFTDSRKNDNDKRSTDCNEVPNSKLLLEQNAKEIAYKRLVMACERIKTIYNQIASYKEPQNKSQRIDYFLLGKVMDEGNNIRNEIEKEKAEGGKIKTLIKDIEELSAPDPSSRKELDNKIEEAQKYLKIIKGFAMFSGATKLSQSLEEILAGTLKTTTDSDPATAQRTAAILKLTDSLANAADTFQTEPKIKRVNSLLIAIIELRQKRDMAMLDINLKEDSLHIYEAQQTARLYEFAQLSATKLILNELQNTISLDGDGGGFAVIPSGTKEPGPAVGSMLATYSASWNQGQIPYEILQFKEEQIKRAYYVDVAAFTAQNMNNLLIPALDELAAYGKGGIHPETIATLITNLGLIAAFAAR